MIFIYEFMVQMIISPGIFFSPFYKNINFPGFKGAGGVRVVQRAKNSPQKILSVAPYI